MTGRGKGGDKKRQSVGNKLAFKVKTKHKPNNGATPCHNPRQKTNGRISTKGGQGWREVVIITWNVGGMIGKLQWEVLVMWMKAERPDVVLIQETWALRMKDVDGYDRAEAPAIPPEMVEGRRPTGHAMRGLVTYFRNDDPDVCWKQEGEIEEGAWEIAVVGRYENEKGDEEYIRVVNGYGPQAADTEQVKGQLTRYEKMFMTPLGRRREDGKYAAVINVLGADQNVADVDFGSRHDNDTKEPLNALLRKLDMTRLQCRDENGDRTTNYHTTKTAKGVPDVIAISRSSAHRGRTSIEHVPKLPSGASHERIKLSLSIQVE